MRSTAALGLALSILVSACAGQLPAQTLPSGIPATQTASLAKTPTRKVVNTRQIAETEALATFREIGVTPTATELASAESFLTKALAEAEALADEQDHDVAAQTTLELPDFFVSPEPTVNETTLLIDDTEIFPDLLQHLRAAESRIQMDVFLLGGEIGTTIADALIERKKAGVQVELMMDPSLGLGGPTTDGIQRVARHLQANGIEFRFYPLSLFGKMGNALQRKMQIDHNKVIVIDESTAYVGGMNFDDLARPNHDLTLRFSGPAAAEVSAMLDAEWGLGTTPDASKFATKAEGLVRLTQTAPQQKNNKANLLKAIGNAQRSIRVAMYEFGDPEMAQALVEAYGRGVDVRVMLDPKNESLKKYGAGALPDGIPNIMPARELVAVGAQVRWFVPWRNMQELHMKAMSVDGNLLMAGSTNWTRNAFTNYRETGFVLEGSEVAKFDAMYDDMWENHAERIKKLTLKQRLTAKVVDILHKRNLEFY